MFSLDLHSWWEAGSNSANTPWGAFNVKGFTLNLLFLITGEISECHQVFLWTSGGHQAVYVELLETNALFLCYVCVIFTVSSQRSDRTLTRRTPMTPWRFIRCRYSVSLNLCFLIIIFLFLSLRKEFVCHLIFFYAIVSAAKSRDNDRKRSHRSGRNSPTQATPQKADVSSADDPGESEQARLDMQYHTDKIHLTTWGWSIQIKQKIKIKSNLKMINNHLK